MVQTGDRYPDSLVLIRVQVNFGEKVQMAEQGVVYMYVKWKVPRSVQATSIRVNDPIPVFDLSGVSSSNDYVRLTVDGRCATNTQTHTVMVTDY